MPLRKPKTGETQSEWMSYCVPQEIGEGPDKRDQDQAVAICLSNWRAAHGGKPPAPKGLHDEVDRWRWRLQDLGILKADDDDGSKPYGDVDYADPGYQEDGKKRYPVDTEAHIRAAWNYIARKDNQKPYTSDQVKKIKQRIVAAWRRVIDEDGPPGLDEDEHLGKAFDESKVSRDEAGKFSSGGGGGGGGKEDGGKGRMSKVESAVANDFKKETGAKDVSASYDADGETWTVEADGETYTMEVGGDDDNYSFTSSDGKTTVEFDFTDENTGEAIGAPDSWSTMNSDQKQEAEDHFVDGAWEGYHENLVDSGEPDNAATEREAKDSAREDWKDMSADDKWEYIQDFEEEFSWSKGKKEYNAKRRHKMKKWHRRQQYNGFEAPEPATGESRADFIDRCTAQVTRNGADEGEAESLCALAWENRSSDHVRLRHKTHSGLLEGMEFVLSDDTPDRMGDIICSTGWDLTNFRKNPIALFNHKADFPIGKWQNLRADRDGLKGRLVCAPEGTSERIDEVRRLIEAGILKAVSVGFKPIESRPRNNVAKDGWVGEHFLKQELVETSLVSVPANPNALAIAKSLNISDDTLDAVFAEHGREGVVRRNVDHSGKHAENHKRNEEDNVMSLAQRIEETQGQLNDLRNQLTDHLGQVDDENVSDNQMETTNDLNARIAQKQKHLATLVESERLMMGSRSEEEERRKEAERRKLPAVVKTNGDALRRDTAFIPPHVHSRSPRIPESAEERLELIVRAGIVTAVAHTKKISIEAARALLGKDLPRYNEEATKVFSNYVARAEAAPAMTTVDGWAAELVQQVYHGMLELLMPKSVFPQLASLGLSLSFGRAGRISIPTRERTPTIAGSFVGEGRPIPVRQGLFSAQILTPKKMAVITTWTRELDESSIPAVEGLLRQAIQEDTAISIDSVLLDAVAADDVRPAGLLNGVTATAASAIGAEGRFGALVQDLKNLTGSLLAATHGNVRKMTLLMNPLQTLSVSLTALPGVSTFPFKDEVGAGRLLSYSLIESGTVPAGRIIAIDAADFVVAGGEAPRFEVSDQATLHMEDTDPDPIVSGPADTPPSATATPVRSLWQTDSLALRLILPLNWTMRRPDMIAYIAAVNW